MNRAQMKALARSCAEALTPSRMTVVGSFGSAHGTSEIDMVAFPGVEFRPPPQPVYARHQDQTPEPYPIYRRDRFGKVTIAGIVTPTAPLRRVR